jgi:general secretion pathway protein F
MPSFAYTALTAGGELAHGLIDAADEAAAQAQLRRQGSIPVRTRPASATRGLLARGQGRLSRQEVSEVTRELSVMLAAGQDLDGALRFLVETAAHPRPRKLLAALRDQVRGGAAFAAALAAHPASFPRLYVGLVRAGEGGGDLATALDQLATLLERERALMATVTSALIYPTMLLLAAVGSIALLLTTVLPQFVPLFAQNGAHLPAATQLLIDAGAAVSAFGLPALLLLAGLGFGLRLLLRRPAARLAWDRALLRLPLAGRLAQEVLAARFSRTLGTLLLNGVPLMAALGIVADAVGNTAAVAAVAAARASAGGGGGLSAALAADGVFPARMIHLLRLGEETAQLGQMALRAADIHEARARTGIQRLLALLTPSITIVMGGAIAFIVVSLLLAMLGLNDLAAG